MNKSKEEVLAACNAIRKNTLLETLGIEFVDVTTDGVVARMPVNSTVHQPDGVLHGGASVALAETVGSMASILFLKGQDVSVRGIEISANHVKSVSDGYVYAKASVLHKGRTTQLWSIPIVNDKDELISMVKLTTITLKK
jgi:1,4-dihydroxy-2-naphthoyl-CoA hydrolase